MNKLFRFVPVLMGSVLLFCACERNSEESPTPPPTPTTDELTNGWIENVMRDWYLWNAEIPAIGSLDLRTTPEVFFESLLSSKDGKRGYNYSYIVKKEATGKSYLGDSPTFGFEFQLWHLTDVNQYLAGILYVLPNSPAAQSGIMRGDYIVSVNGQPLSPSNYQLLISKAPLTVGVVQTKKKDAAAVSLRLTPQLVVDNPVFLDTIYTINSQRIGYLVYNHFTSGPVNENDETFNNDLRRAFSRFHAGGVTEFILDLRYNNGGLFSCAQLLSTMLAPASALGQEFCHLEYNEKHRDSNVKALFDTRYMKQGTAGENLGLSRLFVITSTRSASSSELVINGLRPYFKEQLIVVGEKTEGKNVGSITISNSKYNYVLHPIVSKVYNRDNQSDYVNGILPQWEAKEDLLVRENALGETDKEILLSTTLQVMAFGRPLSLEFKTAATNKSRIALYNSLDRRKSNGVEITLTDKD